MGNFITKIAKNSIAAELGIRVGSKVISVNGNVIKDVFDYRFALQDEYIEILIKEADETECVYEIEKEYYEDLGLEFETGLMDDAKSCRNKCVFCFIDQLPRGMRKTLYFKDDDSRLSFLSGNYVTLTNMTDDELDRIIYYRLSPINISVHTTDPELRRTMLKADRAREILRQIEKLAEAGISMNFQIVLCKDINDGEKLDETIKALSDFMPHGKSLSVVPAGLTKYRDTLHPLSPYSGEECADLIEKINGFQKSFLKTHRTRFVYAADEFYVKAGLEFPSYKSYEDFYQIENGVGMAAQTLHTLSKALSKRGGERPKGGVSIGTGVCAYPLMLKCRDMIKAKFPQLDIRVHKIENKFFGNEITVSGLLTGADIINSLKTEELCDILLLPENTLKADTDIFLDDVTALDVERSLNRRVYFCGDDNFLDTVLQKR